MIFSWVKSFLPVRTHCSADLFPRFDEEKIFKKPGVFVPSCGDIPSPAFVFPCPHLSAGETSSKYRHSALDETANEPAVRKEPIYFFPPCLRASVVQRSCLN